LRTQVEQWFDHEMDRIAGVYKRVSQYMMLILGVVLALALNVDSVRVARTLWETPALRTAVADQAAQAVTQPAAAQPNGGKPPPAAGSAAPTAGATTPAADSTKPVPDASKAVSQVSSSYQALEATQIPFGWDTRKALRQQVSFMTVGGWAFTAAAVGLGAPFWFALLQSLVNVRAAGPAPKPSSSSDGSNKGTSR
jgi:hypothetical protein